MKLNGWKEIDVEGGPPNGEVVQTVQHSISWAQPVAMLMSCRDGAWYWEPGGSSVVPTHWRKPVLDGWPTRAEDAREIARVIGQREATKRLRAYAARREIEDLLDATVDIMTDINGHLSFERRPD